MMTKLIKGADGKIHSHSSGVEALERAPKKDSRTVSRVALVKEKSQKDNQKHHTDLLDRFHIYTPKRPHSIYTISITKYVLRPNIHVFKHFHGYKWFTIGFSGTEMVLVKAPEQSPNTLKLSVKNHSCYNGVTSANLIRHIKSHVPVQYRDKARHFRALVAKPNFIVFDLSKPY